MNDLIGGYIGEGFAALAFASAIVAMVSFFWADASDGKEKTAWGKLGIYAMLGHIFSIFGVIGTIFYLIYTHQYQYQYVWEHSSNELPVYYIISCFWEGQEGSFLLWCFWHCVLSFFVMRTQYAYRYTVLAIMASVEIILSSMILGIFIPESLVSKFYLLMTLLPMGYFSWRLMKNPQLSGTVGVFSLASIFLGGFFLLMYAKGNLGFGEFWSWQTAITSIDGIAFTLYILFWLIYTLSLTVYMDAVKKQGNFFIWDIFAALLLIIIGAVAIWFEQDIWKVGSTPFLSLKDAFPNNEAYQIDPEFVPQNGSGLNPLLQNYWMVIHPPTLFLGFSSTLIPFAFVLAALIRGNYTSWIRYTLPWTTFSVMILGTGIIMGGYWAYETLNFGGYWNWDPVENGSLVPWLCGVAAIHGMLIYQKSKQYLRLAMILIVSTFLLVLYATFLTRSGILGDGSVHAFTDLGLAGQLLILILVYLVKVIVLFAFRWKDIPHKNEELNLNSAEFFLFLGILVLLFSSTQIILSTSLPVFNEIFGTQLAPPVKVQLYYYKWNVWFAIGFGVLSGIAQFFWFKLKKGKSISDALFRPFLLTTILGAGIIFWIKWRFDQFAYDEFYRDWVEIGELAGGITRIGNYLQYIVFSLADELLLFSSLFVILANGDILISMLRTSTNRLKVMGGTLAHMGFGLMLLGILFSSGYEEVVSKNITPAELEAFPEKERVDNIPLLKNRPRNIEGYQLIYKGKREALKPIKELEIIEQNEVAFKLKFKDARGDVYGMVLPNQLFRRKDSSDISHLAPVVDKSQGKPDQEIVEIDLEYTRDFLNDNLETIKPQQINKRTLYEVEFISTKDSADSFTVFPEAELNGQEGIIAHPSRKIYLGYDIYTHVSSTPAPDEDEPEYKYYDANLQMGEKFNVGNVELFIARIEDLSNNEELNEYQVAAAANILAISRGDTFFARPIYVIDKQNKPGMIEDKIDELHLALAFVGVDPEQGVIRIQVQQQVNAQQDYIVIKAIRKPLINLLWLGTFLLTFGFSLSIYRRIIENKRK